MVYYYKKTVWQSAHAFKNSLCRLPTAFGMFYGKIGQRDKKLILKPESAMPVRERVARLNVGLFCVDIGRCFSIKNSMKEAKFNALEEYKTSKLFTDGEKAMLNYVTELTKDKKVESSTFKSFAAFYSEREICEIVYIVASEHVYNMTNIGLNIHSDMLCDIGKKK